MDAKVTLSKALPCEELASRLLLTLQPCPASKVRWAGQRSHDKGQLVEPCKELTWKDKLLSMMNEVGSFKQKRR